MSDPRSRFPDTYRELPNEQLIAIYDQGPDRLNSLLEDLSVKELRARPQADKWSIQEIAIHLADAEIMAAARVRQVFAEPGSTLVVYDQDRWAAAFEYGQFDSKSFYSALMMFDSLRLNTSKIFKRANEQDWLKFGIHPEWGQVTLRQLLELYADHGERHFEQILAIRASLGKTLDFPLLLEKRLY